MGRLSRNKWIVLGATVIAIIAMGVSAKAWRDTMRDPVIYRTTMQLPGMSADVTPKRLVLISDIHVAGPDMPPARLARIVRQINTLSPDLVLIAGDFVSEKRTATKIYPPNDVIAPLAALAARLGVVAVPGNHDHWYGMEGIADELAAANVTLLVNEAAEFGPLIIGGLDDEYTGRDDLPATLKQMEMLEGGRIILSHSPDPFPKLPTGFGLMLAGHTHCGQIRYPWGGAPAYLSKYGDRYACGRNEENRNTIITGAGLGTSIIPVRLFSQPEIWVIEVFPPKGKPPER